MQQCAWVSECSDGETPRESAPVVDRSSFERFWQFSEISEFLPEAVAPAYRVTTCSETDATPVHGFDHTVCAWAAREVGENSGFLHNHKGLKAQGTTYRKS